MFDWLLTEYSIYVESSTVNIKRKKEIKTAYFSSSNIRIHILISFNVELLQPIHTYSDVFLCNYQINEFRKTEENV